MTITKDQEDYNRAVQDINKVYLDYSDYLDGMLRKIITLYLYECIQDRELQIILGRVWNNSEVIRRCSEKL